jgi:hypothetical protein
MNKMNDAFSPDVLKYLKTNVEKLSNSHAYLGIVTPNFLEDTICAFQLGLAVMMDKPIILIVDEGTEISGKLKSIADEVYYVDMKDNAALEKTVNILAADFLRLTEE